MEMTSLNDLPFKDRMALRMRGVAMDFSNFHLLHYRHVDGFLISAKNSGTHWLKYMLSHAIAAEYRLPPPQFASGRQANDFVGHPKWGKKYPQAPRIGSSHNLASSFLAWGPIYSALRLPPVVVLVRDIEQAMISHYVKWHEETGLSLSDYVRAPAPGRKYVADIWWYIEFFNRWGRFAQKRPQDILVVRYEDLQGDPRLWLQTIVDHYRLNLSLESIDIAVRMAERETMRRELDPNAGELIIPADADRFGVRFSAADKVELRTRLGSFLKFNFGYGYAPAR
jgi:hypothetical protein